MKKNLFLAVAMIFGAATAYSQAYISISGGYGFETNKKVIGRDASTTGSVTELKGSYGAGFQTQLRGGYFFTKRWGAELSVGYLQGEEITTNKTAVSEIKGRGRAFGVSLSAVFNITDNLYVRAGGVTKIGGQTESFTSLSTKVPAQIVNPAAPAGMTVDLNADFQTNFHGKIPFGFIGGLGYRFKVAEKISLFVEGEYLLIDVARKKSKLKSFSGSLAGNTITAQQLSSALSALDPNHQLIPLLQEEYDWQGKGAPDAPYSSIGLHLGLTYTF